MKKKLFLICMLAMSLTACHKSESGIDPNGETTDTLVKKYLVKQLLNDDPEKIMLDIEWNDDFTKILHVKYGLGYGSVLNYDFTHFDNDSILVTMSLPPHSYPIYALLYDSLMIHLKQERIDSICCYANGTLSDVEHYSYNENGKLIERMYFGGALDFFEWDGDDVVECKMFGMYRPITIDSFVNYIHPHYTLPYYLVDEVFAEGKGVIFTPLWKHQPVWENYNQYEADEDGYITKMIHVNSSDSLERCISYYYGTYNNSSR